MQIISTDVVVIGGGGAGLRAAIAAAEADPALSIALVSKVLPMRSHTVAAEGGSAGVVRDDDSLDKHFDDTVSGGDWLCDQDVVDYFVTHCTEEMVQLERWGCPWSRKAGRQRQCPLLRRHDGAAHLVRRRQERLPHPAHAVPDLVQVSGASSATTNISAPT